MQYVHCFQWNHRFRENHWVYCLLSQKEDMSNVLYCYGIYQDRKKNLSQISEQLNSLKENSIIILDGLARRIVNSQDMEELFTMGYIIEN